MSNIEQQYLNRTPLSGAAFAEAGKVVAGGNSRGVGFWFPYPFTLKRAEGHKVWDIDGNEYIDLIYNYTVHIHGHSFPPIVEAARSVMPHGTCWPAGNESQPLVAAQLVERVPSVDLVRFTNTGTEAANLALHIARRLTGRNKVLMARYGYHGQIWEHLISMLNEDTETTLLAEFNDLGSFQRKLDEHGDDIAAVFIEPVQGAGGVNVGTPEFLRGLCDITRAAGALIVFDEVMMFRLAHGGYQSVVGASPDLTMFGKFIGGGFPVGAIGGKAEYMSVFDPNNPKVFHSGTFGANPVSMAAGKVALDHLGEPEYQKMERLAKRLQMGLIAAAERQGLPFICEGIGSFLNIYFLDEKPVSVMERTDEAIMKAFFLAALNRGVFMSSRGMLVMCTVMDEAIIDEVAGRMELAMQDVAAQIS